MAPRFVVVAGAADMPDGATHACAMETRATDSDGHATRWLHRCEIERAEARWRWRMAATASSGGAEDRLHQSLEGTAPSLADAIADAVGAVRRTSGAVPDNASLAPAFVETRREAGLPRSWICAFLMSQDAADAEWTHLQRCTIREFPGRGAAFSCEVGGVPREALLAGLRAGFDEAAIMEAAGLGQRHWTADCLETAMRDCLARAMTGAVIRRRGTTRRNTGDAAC